MVPLHTAHSSRERGSSDRKSSNEHVFSSPHEPCSEEELGGNQVEHSLGGKDEVEVPAPLPESAAVDVVERTHESFLMVYLRRLKGAGQPGPAFFSPSWDGIPTFLFTAITLMVLAVIEAFGLQPYNLGMLSYLPSFGASCCLVMCLLTSPGAQPRAMIFSHIFGAFFGVSWAHITNDLPKPLSQQIACAFAVAMMTSLMMLTGTLQPSASATTCLAAFHLYGQMKDQGFMFMVTPAALGGSVIVVMGWIQNNLIPWRHCYPLWW